MWILLIAKPVLFPLDSHRAQVGITIVFYTVPSQVLMSLIILKYLRSKSVILSVPMASIFLFSFFFKKWLKIAQKSSTCSLIKMQAIKVCDEVKKKIPFPSHHSTLKGRWQLSFLHWCPSFHFQSVDPSWVHIPISVTPRCWFIAIFWYNCRDLHIWDIWNSFG